jgi:ElaB/YqjD/DUF883 family membrane-anchored ribosome-binding protein
MSDFNEAAQTAAHKVYTGSTETLRPVMEQLLASVHDAVDRLSGMAAQAAGKAEMAGVRVKNAQREATRSTRAYVREQPLTSIGIALATGYLVSWLLRKD